MCDALTQQEKRVQTRTDATTYRLHLQFVRAHGAPKGELTTLAAVGSLISGVERHK